MNKMHEFSKKHPILWQLFLRLAFCFFVVLAITFGVLSLIFAVFSMVALVSFSLRFFLWIPLTVLSIFGTWSMYSLCVWINDEFHFDIFRD